MIKALVLDFDGVIVDSEPIKQQGFSLMFSEFGEPVPKREIDSARADLTGRGNRADIIRGVFERMGETDAIDAKVAEYVRRYGEVVDKRVRQLRVSDDARQAMTVLSQKIPLYVNSLTPEEVLQESIHALGVAPLFKGIYGTPRNKVENLGRIVQHAHVPVLDTLFVGDTEGDADAAHTFGCQFVGFGSRWEGTGIKSISQLSELLEILTQSAS